MKVLVDTNILLRQAVKSDPQYVLVTDALVSARAREWNLCVANQNFMEFWAVATRPLDVNGLGLTTDRMAIYLLGLRDTFSVLSDPPDLFERWLGLCLRYDVKGKPSHDARMVAVMLAHGIRHILTLNPRDFVRYTDVTCLAPGDLA